MRKRILSLLLCIMMVLTQMPTVAFAAESLTELHITGSITSVEAGELPAIDAEVASGEHASVEPYYIGSGTGWSKYISGEWHDVGSDKIAVNDGSTHYAMRLCVETESGYSITNETKIFYNGSEISGAISFISDWGAYVRIDLGTAGATSDPGPTTYYGVYVSGVRVSSANMNDVLGDGKVSFEVKDGTPTLTILSGANITNTGSSGALIYSSMSDGLTINAPSGLTLSTTGSGKGILMNDIGPLTINGNVNISTQGVCIDTRGKVIINGNATVNSSSYEGINALGDISVNGSVNVRAGAYGLYSGNGDISISKDVTIKSSYNSIYAPKGAVNIASGATWKMDSSGYTICAKDIIIPSGSAIIEPADGEISESGSSKRTPDEHVIIGPAVVKYTVTFNMNGHGTQVPAQTVEKGNKASKPADPSASGYTFGGWYADATFFAAFDFNTAITADTPLYAKWTENTSAPATGTIAISKSFFGLDAGVAIPTGTTFTVTDSTGTFNQSYTIGESFNKSDRGLYICNINVPAGTYTITESNSNVTGYNAPSVFYSGLNVTQNGNSATVVVAADESSGVIITNSYTPDTDPNPTRPTTPSTPTQPKLDASPKTGDATQTALWIGMLTLAFGTAAVALYIGRKKEQA